MSTGGELPWSGRSERNERSGREPWHALTIDVEDWFQVENLKQQVSRSHWDEIPRRVVQNTDAILEILRNANDTKATFFVLGWIAEREPALVKRIARAGHEVASHGYNHELVYAQSGEAFRADVRASRELLQDIVGQPVIGYRAPSFSMTEAGLEILAEEGFRYDSSWFPAAAHDRYAKLDLGAATRGSPAEAPGSGGFIQLPGGLWELPLTTLEVLGRALPWAGGGYFRLIPYPLYRAGFARAARQRGGASRSEMRGRRREASRGSRHGGPRASVGRSGSSGEGGGCVFYLHPWELDAGQPRVGGLRPLYRFRHYVGLARTADRLRRLVCDFSFCPVRDRLAAIESG